MCFMATEMFYLSLIVFMLGILRNALLLQTNCEVVGNLSILGEDQGSEQLPLIV